MSTNKPAPAGAASQRTLKGHQLTGAASKSYSVVSALSAVGD